MNTGRARLPSAAGAGLVAALLLAAVLAGWLAPYDPRASVAVPLRRPDRVHLLGTNDLGQDLVSVWLHAARLSLGLGFVVGGLSTGLSALAGSATVLWPAARVPLLAVIDALLAVPHLPLVVLVVALVGPGVVQLAMVLILIGWPAYARVVRAQVQAVVQRDYVEAARALGSSTARILRACVLPEIAPILWTKFLLTVRWAILMEATLSLLGLADPGQASWGTMLQSAFTYPLLFAGEAWLWWALPPAASIALLTLALAAMGRDFETWLNPRAR